jgi:hypothetical protein
LCFNIKTLPIWEAIHEDRTMAKGEQRSNKMAKKPKKDTSAPKTYTSDRPMAPSTYVAPRGKEKDKAK